jgi:AsmA protein
MKLLKIAGIVVAVLLVVVIALPFLIDVNRFRPQIESTMSTALGRQVGVGNLGLSLLSGSVVADDITIADDPAFSKSAFVTAKSLKVDVEVLPLIFSKKLNVTEITLEHPEIALLKAGDGKWNFSSIGAASSQQPPPQATQSQANGVSSANFSVAKLKVDDGRLIVSNVNSSAMSQIAKPQIYDKVNIEVDNFSFTSQFPFKLTANLPGGGDASVSGKAGPISSADAAKTPFEATVKVTHLDIATSGFIDPASGFGGLADFNGTLNSNGSLAKATGTFTGTKLKLSPKGTPASTTVIVRHAVEMDLDNQSGTLTQGDVEIGKAVAHLTGTFQTQGQTQSLNMKLGAPDMPVDELEAMLPAMGVVLPSGSQLKGGTLSANLSIVGPIDKLVITGPVKLANTKLANFDLGAKLGGPSSFAGKAGSSPDTTIQNASLDAHVAPEGTKADNINLTVPAIGVITGGGTVSPAGDLNFKMLADLKGGMMGGLTQVASMGNSKGGIPFSIDGTTSNPHFVPDMKGVATGMAKGILGNVTGGQNGSPNSPVNALSGLFGKKKK